MAVKELYIGKGFFFFGDLQVDEVDEIDVLRSCHSSNAGCRSSQGEGRWTIPICRRGMLQMQGAWLKQEQFRVRYEYVVPRLQVSLPGDAGYWIFYQKQ